MKFNEKWLREWVDPQIDRDALLEQLTMAGLEVEGAEPVAGEFAGVVVAKVLSADKHPNADKLSVCQVSDGADTHQVVCGAPNVRRGLVTAFARVGAVLPDNFKIKKAKLRDVESRGMLCSAAELGLGDDADGIIELAEDAVIGADLRDALTLDDVTIDLDLTPNRGDCLSVRGLAREVGVLNNQPVTQVQFEDVAPAHDDVFPVELADPAGCPRYLGRVIRGVDVNRPSPLWMQEKLRRAGLRSIDPIVDVTNFVMLELGQPMHAFDLRQLHEKIVVRKAHSGESLTLLDGQEVVLDETTLLIADGNGPVAIAGVMGGERSGVQADTTDVFLECAFFAPLTVAGTARRYGLHTDASHRYERGVDFELQRQAVQRATGLLIDIVGGEPGPIAEALDQQALPVAAEVSVREARLNTLLGISIDPAQVDAILQQLGFELLDRDVTDSGVVWTIRAPSHRFDIDREADLVEEVCRIYGYDNVPSRMPASTLGLRQVPLRRSPAVAMKRQLVGLGYQEVITYSFVDPRLQDLLAPGLEPLTLENPMSMDQSVMRINLLPGLLSALGANVSRQQARVRLFELGMVFVPGGQLTQRQNLGMVVWGRRDPESWNQGTDSVDFFDLKGDVERLLAFSGAEDVEYVAGTQPILHPGQCATVLAGGEEVGYFGRLHPEIEARLDVTGPVLVGEFSAEFLLQRTIRGYRGVSKYPSVRRDLSLLVGVDTTAAAITRIVEQALGEMLVEFTLFDVYQGKGIDSTEKSIGLGLTLQHPSATLTEEDIGRYVGNAVEALSLGVDARLR